MAVLAGDPDAWSLANRSLATLEKMQARHPSGAVIGDGETRFPSAQTGLFMSLGQSWLVLAVADQIHDAPKSKTGILRLDAGKILLHRTPRVVNSVSWGAKIMAMCVPLRLDRIISPDQRSGIGHIRLAGSDASLPVKKIDAQVTNDENSFAAHLVLEHGRRQIRAEIQIASNAAGEFTLSEKLTAMADVTTQEIATGLVGILNNPHWVYETGQRQLTFDNKPSSITALSGESLRRPNTSAITIDDTLQITSNKPLSTMYQAAKAVDRGRATDKLYLNFHGQEATYHQGDVISEYSIHIRRIDE
jgi:hypothetical protein